MDPAAAGHFTTLQVRGGKAQGRDLHLDRVVDASRALYGSGPSRHAVRAAIRAALAKAAPRAGDCTLRVRVHPPAAGGRGDRPGPAVRDPALRIEVDVEAPRHPPTAPLRVRTHAGLRERPEVKHLALGFQQAARRAAREAGCDDALLTAPDGRISEGSFWNILFWDGRGAVWPEAPALAGVTQRILRDALDRAGIGQRRQAVTVQALGGVQAAFALNSTGIADIAAIDGHGLPGDPSAGALLRRLLAAAPWDDF